MFERPAFENGASYLKSETNSVSADDGPMSYIRTKMGVEVQGQLTDEGAAQIGPNTYFVFRIVIILNT